MGVAVSRNVECCGVVPVLSDVVIRRAGVNIRELFLVFDRFSQTFLDVVPVTLESLRHAVRAGDVDGIATAAHVLKWASLNVWVEGMANISLELDESGKSGTSEDAAPLAAKLDELYLAVKKALEARLDQQERRNDALSVRAHLSTWADAVARLAGRVPARWLAPPVQKKPTPSYQGRPPELIKRRV